MVVEPIKHDHEHRVLRGRRKDDQCAYMERHHKNFHVSDSWRTMSKIVIQYFFIAVCIAGLIIAQQTRTVMKTLDFHIVESNKLTMGTNASLNEIHNSIHAEGTAIRSASNEKRK